MATDALVRLRLEELATGRALPRAELLRRLQPVVQKITYYHHRNNQARRSHRKRRLEALAALNIQPSKLPQCLPKSAL
jgi:hypothetical protein